MLKKARDLKTGDLFRLHVYGEVLNASPVAGGKRIQIKIGLEDQGQRRQRGVLSGLRQDGLEFTDNGHVVEFLCLPSRAFRIIENWDDDDGDGDEIEIGPVPTPEDELV
jgi:hypothetical protein